MMEMQSSAGLQVINHPINEDHHFINTIKKVSDLWIEQIIVDVDFVRNVLSARVVDERLMLQASTKVARIQEILSLISNHIQVASQHLPQSYASSRSKMNSLESLNLETVKFKLMEIKLGINKELCIGDEEDIRIQTDPKINLILNQDSLFDVVNEWLSRTPGLEKNGFNFFKKVEENLTEVKKKEEKKLVDSCDPQERHLAEAAIKKIEEYQTSLFNGLLDREKYERRKNSGEIRFSHKANQGVLMISSYQNEPRFQIPYKFLTELSNVDEALSKWRYTYACFIQRFEGLSIQINSRYSKLRSKCGNKYKVFPDLWYTSTFLVLRKWLPQLDEETRSLLSKYNHT